MPKVNLADIEVQMVLAEDVIGAQGRPLLPQGTVITPKHIRIMKTWGIHSVCVEGEEPPSAQAEKTFSAAVLQAAEQNVTPRFQHVDLNHPLLSYLFKEAVRQNAHAIDP